MEQQPFIEPENYVILYVDDERDNLITFKSVFRRYYQVLTAGSPTEALGLLDTEEIHLIISDQRMPEMTGVELFEEVKARFPEIMRIILTGYSDLEAVIDSINRGQVFYFVSKPWDVKEFKIIIDRALEMYSLKKRNMELEVAKKELLLKVAQQEKENLLAQFNTLKEQMNPHFLFNSLNTLRSILKTKPELADTFTKHFARVYRSLLDLHDQFLVSLRDELQFVRSFIALQEFRFEDGLNVEINIPDHLLFSSLPPFTLQTLVENAIKHNIVSKAQPLHIRISASDEFLEVKNNLQRRTDIAESTGIGLKNLRRRYEMLKNLRPEIHENTQHFIVRVPLIMEA